MTMLKRSAISFLVVFITALLLYVQVANAECPEFCGTDPKVMQELNSSLLQRKMTELTHTYSQSKDSYMAGLTPWGRVNPMPSTGDVKALVVLIEFADYKLPDDVQEHLANKMFSYETDLTEPYERLSIINYFKKLSFDRLHLSATILPAYTTNEKKYDNLLTEKKREWWINSIVSAIEANIDVVGDLSDYDANNDGYLDCVCVIFAGGSDTPGTKTDGWWPSVSSAWNEKTVCDEKKLKTFAHIGIADGYEDYGTKRIIAHEMIHLLGLPDSNYFKFGGFGCNEVTASFGSYVSALYRFFLNWDDVEILPYEDKRQEIDLYAVDIYNDNVLNNRRSVIFLPDTSTFPIAEFYIAEYRAKHHLYFGELDNTDEGVIIWHCKVDYNSFNDYWLTVVPKSNDLTKEMQVRDYDGSVKYFTGFYFPQDAYFVGDVFSDTTVPSSKFYSDVYTGAYLKVLSIDEEKATVYAGFIQPKAADSQPAVNILEPTITANEAAPVAMPEGGKDELIYQYLNIELPVKFENYTDILKLGDVEVITTGTVSYNVQHQGKTMNECYQFNTGKIELSDVRGEGTIQVKLKSGIACNGITNASLDAISEEIPVNTKIFYVDKTPPEIVLNGDSEITLKYGEAYVELGAKVTDYDSDIESKLIIDSSRVKVTKPGKYYVYYSAADNAGNTSQVIRTVTVLKPDGSVYEPPKYEITVRTSRTDFYLYYDEDEVAPNPDDVKIYVVDRFKNSQNAQLHCSSYPKVYKGNDFNGIRFSVDATKLSGNQSEIDVYIWDKNTMKPLFDAFCLTSSGWTTK